MAFIGTLRSKMGTWVVVFVFVAIGLFILGDLFSGNTSIFSLDSNDVGEIAGHTVTLEEFQGMVKEREANYFLNFNRQPGDREMPTLRQQAWELLILRYAIQPEFKKVGVEVTTDEVYDMVQGENVDENVKMAFTDQQTGQFDRSRVIAYLQQLKTMPESSEPRVRWELFQRDLLPARERIKYENLLIKTNYVTTAEAESFYHESTDVAEIKYLYIPYYATSDSTVTVTDADLNDYYNKHKEKYKTEDSRSFSYVTIPVVPSAQDSLEVREEVQRIAADFATSEDDSVFAASATEGQNPYAKYSPANLPAFVNASALEAGKVIGPFIDGEAYKVVKVSKISKDTVFSARARHILVKWTDESAEAKKTAKDKANNVLKELKGGANFAVKAREVSEDPGSATRGGDLGWFSNSGPSRMVKPFEDAVFGATKSGLVANLVETQYGYHIIDVTDTKNNTAYTLAVVERAITPGDATTNEAYRKAEVFSADLSGVEDFKARAQKEGLAVLDAKNVQTGDRRIGPLGEARDIFRWLFTEASTGKVSNVFDLHDSYVVAVMTEGVKKGYKPLDVVKDEITPLVRNELKGKAIIKKLGGIGGSLEEMATSFGSDANVYSSSDVRLNSSTLPTAGFDPHAVGVAFSLESGKRSKAFAGENGVLVIELQNKTISPSVADYAAYKAQLENGLQNRTSINIGQAIKEASDIVDERYKYY
jgi:peptidyl-prolyl cis-trans isomerase D